MTFVTNEYIGLAETSRCDSRVFQVLPDRSYKKIVIAKRNKQHNQKSTYETELISNLKFPYNKVLDIPKFSIPELY